MRLVVVVPLLLLASTDIAAGSIIHGGLAGMHATARDTTQLLGGPGRFDGSFENEFGVPNWHGWTHVDAADSVGDFARILSGLQDIDPCKSNVSPQAVFIDDGVVVPGTGGTVCQTWCYGPGGYIVNNTGGLAGEDAHLDNLLLSPILAWPAGNDGALLEFDVYRQNDFVPSTGAGIIYQWQVRSITTGDPADMASAPWRDRYGVDLQTGYERASHDVTALLRPGRTHVQIGLRCVEYGWRFGYEGYDGTPAPYFDNVALRVFPHPGPAMSAQAADLAQDGFPERGMIDLDDLSTNWIRFDMARNIAERFELHNDPGDSLVIDVQLVRAGAIMPEPPRLVVKLKANPLFDGVRTLPAGFTQSGDIIDGWVPGGPARNEGGAIVAGRWQFDLPDTGFFYPGDVLHYHFEARDQVGGEVGVSTLPANLEHFGDFGGVQRYGPLFEVRGLPTLTSAAGAQPRVLFWDDAGDSPYDRPEWRWRHALGRIGMSPGQRLDIFTTNAADEGVGNGLGSRATASTLAGYDVLLYTCGDATVFTLGNNDYFADPSNDLALLSSWFLGGDKRALLSGDNLVESLAAAGPQGFTFMSQYLGVSLAAADVGPLVQAQAAPRVRALDEDSVFIIVNDWTYNGGCPAPRHADAILVQPGTELVAEFLDPSGAGGVNDWAAATRRQASADVITLPYDLGAIVGDPLEGGVPRRAAVLRDILIEFGIAPGDPVAVPDAAVLAVTAYPNPFNPRTVISLDLPQTGRVAVRVFDIRGRAVRTLQDGDLDAGHHELVWNGDDDGGRAVASGVYFYAVQAAGQERLGKLTLVR